MKYICGVLIAALLLFAVNARGGADRPLLLSVVNHNPEAASVAFFCVTGERLAFMRSIQTWERRNRRIDVQDCFGVLYVTGFARTNRSYVFPPVDVSGLGCLEVWVGFRPKHTKWRPCQSS